MNRVRSRWLSLFLLVWPLLGWAAKPALRLPAIFSDHMVLLAGEALPVWGWGVPRQKVTVTLAGQTRSADVSAEGTWKVVFDPLAASETPQVLTVVGDTTLTVHDVLVGEVWLAGGQSNMGLTVSRSPHFEMEKLFAGLPTLRMFIETSEGSEQRADDCVGQWVVCSAETVGRFSGVAYFFARQVQRAQSGAMGVINTSVGGTYIESWIPQAAQRAVPALAPSFALREKTLAAFDPPALQARLKTQQEAWEKTAAEARAAGKPEPRKPGNWAAVLAQHQRQIDIGGLFNGRIAPLAPYAIRGVVWYQGESNAVPDRVPLYAAQLRLLVKTWREAWGQALPFAWVQLPNLQRVESWVHVREAQLQALDQPKTGMVVTLDLGESRNLHPLDKEGVGLRLAQWALGTVYGRGVCPSGPLVASHRIQGHEVRVTFRYCQDGLVARGPLNGFVIAGADRVWRPADARIEGNDTVVVSSPEVAQPMAVRYAWKDDPPCTLYNGVGLSAAPFRTDDEDLFAPRAGKSAGR